MSPPYTTPDMAAAAYVAAITAGDEGAARMASTKAGWTPPPAESPAAVFMRLTGRAGSGLVHQLGQGAVAGERAIEVTVATQDGQPVFPLFLLLERHFDSWRIAGIIPVPGYAKAFLQGRVGPLLDPRELQPAPAIVPFAEQLVAWLDGDPLPPEAPPWLPNMIGEWRSFVQPKPGTTFVQRTLDLPAFGRAAAMFMTEDPGGARHVRWLVATAPAAKGGLWTPVWFGIDFSANALLAKLD